MEQEHEHDALRSQVKSHRIRVRREKTTSAERGGGGWRKKRAEWEYPTNARLTYILE